MGNINSNMVAKSSSATTKLICGLDLGDKESQLCTCTAEGEVVEEGKVRTTMAGLHDLEGLLEANERTPEIRALVEAELQAVSQSHSKIRLLKAEQEELAARRLHHPSQGRAFGPLS